MGRQNLVDLIDARTAESVKHQPGKSPWSSRPGLIQPFVSAYQRLKETILAATSICLHPENPAVPGLYCSCEVAFKSSRQRAKNAKEDDFANNPFLNESVS